MARPRDGGDDDVNLSRACPSNSRLSGDAVAQAARSNSRARHGVRGVLPVTKLSPSIIETMEGMKREHVDKNRIARGSDRKRSALVRRCRPRSERGRDVLLFGGNDRRLLSPVLR